MKRERSVVAEELQFSAHLTLKDRSETDDHALLAAVFQAAVSKARELGWIV